MSGSPYEMVDVAANGSLYSSASSSSSNDTLAVFSQTVATWLETQGDGEGRETTTSLIDLVNSTTEVPYTPYELRPETYIIPIVFAIIFIVGVLGNGTLVIVFMRQRTMRNVPNT